MSANDRQEGGEHYIQYGELQPWDVILRFGLGYLDGNAVKYLLRWKHKGGLDDIKKARHYLDKLIEEEEEKALEKGRKTKDKVENQDPPGKFRECPDCGDQYVPVEKYLSRNAMFSYPNCSTCREGT